MSDQPTPPHQEDDVLEHALLESLFYNEMAMMDEWSDSMLGAASEAEQHDSDTATEKEILQDFGVGENPNVHATPVVPVSTCTSPPSNPVMSASLKQEVTRQIPLVVGSSGLPATPNPLTTPIPAPTLQQPQQPLVIPPKSRGIKHNVKAPPAQMVGVPKDRQKLVGQFATLAERLGITIPSELLSKLNAGNTATAAVAAAAAAPPVLPEPQQAPTVLKRAAPAPPPQQPSKRRRKPRLHECERRLAELQGENERLKRHLDLVSNRSRQTHEERIQAETKMRGFLKEGGPDEEIQPLLHTFQEMYSDYGKKRFEELKFHLEQLQRLAKPADFTKMGLWTLGGQSNNPRHSISSLLLNELSITPPQSRKIVEQREKIRTVCENLKECLVLLGKLRSLCELKTKIFHDRISKVREMLTPQQVIKLILWINENSATLQTVCPGWQSEQFQEKGAAKQDPSTLKEE